MTDRIEVGYHRFSRYRINDIAGMDAWLITSVKDGPVYVVGYGKKEASVLEKRRWDWPKMLHAELAKALHAELAKALHAELAKALHAELAKAHDVQVLVFYAVNKPSDERVKAMITQNETSGHQGALLA